MIHNLFAQTNTVISLRIYTNIISRNNTYFVFIVLYYYILLLLMSTVQCSDIGHEYVKYVSAAAGKWTLTQFHC